MAVDNSGHLPQSTGESSPTRPTLAIPDPADRYRHLRVIHLIYAMAVVSAGAAACGPIGMFLGACVLTLWTSFHSFDDALHRLPSSDGAGPHRESTFFTETEACRGGVLADGYPCLLRESLHAQTWSDLLTAADGSTVSDLLIVNAGSLSNRLKWEILVSIGVFLALLLLPLARMRLFRARWAGSNEG
jgi:hypothetical protein